MSFKLPTPSVEQLQFSEHIPAGRNIKYDAVAGAGKTTLKLIIAKTYPKIKFLDLTYNSALKNDGRDKVDALGLLNNEVHSYHALCCKYYAPRCITDQGILAILRDPHSVPMVHGSFDAVFLDEQQDMNSVLFRLTLKFMHELCVPNPIIIALGDKHQTLYQYNGADPLYIERVDKIFSSISTRDWVSIDLHTSFRVPSVIAEFVNTRMLHQDRIVSHRKGGRVHYLLAPPDENYLDRLVNKFVDAGFKHSDIYILSGSIRNDPILIRQANYMSRQGKLIHVPTDDQPLSSSMMKNKIVFGSFHQMKGRENKIVIINKFDSRYEAMTKSTLGKCPNSLYVAFTRASEHVVALHGTSKGIPYPPLSFLKIDGLGLPGYSVVPKSKISISNMSVTDLMRGHDCLFLDAIDRDHITITEIEQPDSKDVISFRGEIHMKRDDIQYTEAVSHLYGTAATVAAEIKQSGSCASIEWLRGEYKTADGGGLVSKMLAEITPRIGEMRPGDLLLIANLLHAYRIKGPSYKHQLRQIRGYKWVEGDKFNQSVDRILHHVGKGGEYEKPVQYLHPMMHIHGFIDILQPKTMWEVKMTSAIAVEHRIQLGVYVAMHPNKKEYRLIYGLTNQVFKVEIKDPECFLDRIVRNRLKANTGMSVEEFDQVITDCVAEYVTPIPHEETAEEAALADEMDAYEL